MQPNNYISHIKNEKIAPHGDHISQAKQLESGIKLSTYSNLNKKPLPLLRKINKKEKGTLTKIPNLMALDFANHPT